MSDEKLPKEVIDFIADHIDSALQLEILLLLHKHPERHWTAGEIDTQLRINREWVAEQLAVLSRQRLLQLTQGNAGPGYQYAPADPALASAVAGLAKWHSTHRVAIVNMIYSSPPSTFEASPTRFASERIRRMAEVVYILCFLASAACSFLLLRGYRQTQTRFLLWGGLCFVGLAANNLLLFLDLIVFTQVDLSLWRNLTALFGLLLLLYGLIWDAE